MRLVIALALIMGLGGTRSAMGQLKAAFTVDVDKGCAPLLVRFTDRSTGGPTSWFWDFGNGITSTDPSPLAQIPFSTPGVITVTLTVNNGTETSTFPMNITVLDPPKATITTRSTEVPKLNVSGEAYWLKCAYKAPAAPAQAAENMKANHLLRNASTPMLEAAISLAHTARRARPARLDNIQANNTMQSAPAAHAR